MQITATASQSRMIVLRPVPVFCISVAEPMASGRLDLVTDDLIVCRAEPDGATSHGLDGFLQLTAEWTEGFRDWTPVPEEFTDVGQQVLVRVRQSAQGKASGVPIADDFWFVYEFRGARIARTSIYAREHEALEAAGLQ